MIRITDNFLDDHTFDAIGKTSMVYSKVHWVGRHALSENPLHDLVYKVFCHEWPDGHGSIKGATAWWNIRPVDPKPHSDLESYCTLNGVDYTPDNPPTRTFIYYLKAPENGGQLNIYTKPPLANLHNGMNWKTSETDSIAPIPNRLVSFPIKYIHAVNPYHGNRVSIGMIFWNELPSIYKSSDDFGGQTNPNYNTSFDRPWEKAENQESNGKLTEDYIMGHSV